MTKDNRSFASSMPDENGMEDGKEKGRKTTRIMLRKAQEQVKDENAPSFEVSYGREKSMKEFRKNPLVPIGALTTAAILVGGLMSFRVGNIQLSQYMMRARVVAQGATLGILSLSVAKMHVGNTSDTSDTSNRQSSSEPSTNVAHPVD